MFVNSASFITAQFVPEWKEGGLFEWLNVLGGIIVKRGVEWAQIAYKQQQLHNLS